jgi:hypothetical protein
MKDLDFPIERLNYFFDKHTFEVFGFDEGGKDVSNIPLNIKIQITGVKEYISMGNKIHFIEYTLYILPHKEYSNVYYQILRKTLGRETDINTRSDQYQDIRWVMNDKVSQMLKYFSINQPAICKKVINEIEPFKLNESLIVESKYDSVIRKIVRDIIHLFKYQKEGEFRLPEDLESDTMEYSFPQINDDFSIDLNLVLDENIDGFEVDADYYRDEDTIELTIISNPNSKNEILQDLLKELNETIAHELHHINQHENGYNFPSEPETPFDYYTQEHELDAQVAGFKRRAKIEKRSIESVAREWFNKNVKKHKLNTNQVDIVIKKILERI